MAKKEVVWTETARKQRRTILEYWTDNNKNLAYSEKLIIEIRERIEILSNHPKSGKKANFPNTRVTSMGHYSIFYQVHKTRLIITSFWDNRQGPKDLLKLLKK